LLTEYNWISLTDFSQSKTLEYTSFQHTK